MRKRSNSPLALIIPLICIVIYITALLFNAYRIYMNIYQQQRIAEQEFFDLADTAAAAGVLGFMSSPFQNAIQDSLEHSKTLEGAIISNLDEAYAFEKEQGRSVSWVNNAPRFQRRFGLSSNPFYAPLHIDTIRNLTISAVYSYIDHDFTVEILKQTLTAVLGALSLAFIAFLVQLFSGTKREARPAARPAPSGIASNSQREREAAHADEEPFGLVADGNEEDEEFEFDAAESYEEAEEFGLDADEKFGLDADEEVGLDADEEFGLGADEEFGLDAEIDESYGEDEEFAPSSFEAPPESDPLDTEEDWAMSDSWNEDPLGDEPFGDESDKAPWDDLSEEDSAYDDSTNIDDMDESEGIESEYDEDSALDGEPSFDVQLMEDEPFPEEEDSDEEPLFAFSEDEYLEEEADIEMEEEMNAPPPQGPYSPKSGIGWEAYTLDRLGSELHTCASSEQDLAILVFEYKNFLIEDAEEIYKQLADNAVDFLGQRDLIFERGEKAIVAILPTNDLDQGFVKAEEFHNRIRSAFSGNVELCIGISSRASRLVNADRLLYEATQALERALLDPISPIIAFKSDPEKYRAYIKNKEQ